MDVRSATRQAKPHLKSFGVPAVPDNKLPERTSLIKFITYGIIWSVDLTGKEAEEVEIRLCIAEPTFSPWASAPSLDRSIDQVQVVVLRMPYNL